MEIGFSLKKMTEMEMEMEMEMSSNLGGLWGEMDRGWGSPEMGSSKDGGSLEIKIGFAGDGGWSGVWDWGALREKLEYNKYFFFSFFFLR